MKHILKSITSALLFLLGTLSFSGSVEAVTWVGGTNWNWEEWEIVNGELGEDAAFFTVNTNKTTYSPGETINLSGVIEFIHCANGWGMYYIDTSITGEDEYVVLGWGGGGDDPDDHDGYWRQEFLEGTLTAPLEPGEYTINLWGEFTLSDSWDDVEYTQMDIVIEVTDTAVCGDGIVNTTGEECDGSDGCNTSCEYEMAPIALRSCTGSGTLYLYQEDPFQPIDTQFVVGEEELLIFTRSEADFTVYVDGEVADMTIVYEDDWTFDATVYVVETSPGSVGLGSSRRAGVCFAKSERTRV
jgi:hypothetical protein